MLDQKQNFGAAVGVGSLAPQMLGLQEVQLQGVGLRLALHCSGHIRTAREAWGCVDARVRHECQATAHVRIHIRQRNAYLA